MKPLGRIIVPTIIPERLNKLNEIANNLWWTWNCEVVDMFKSIDTLLWEKTGANPVAFLGNVGNKKLNQMLTNPEFLSGYDRVVEKFDNYMNSTDTWFNKTHPNHKDHMVAYFSAEYGLNETLPIYSGGLGVLSGDHCKSASDLGIPFTAIGLFYRQGYFNQVINCEGIQETAFSTLNINELPIEQVLDAKGDMVLISVNMPGRTVYASIWLVKVGRVSLYLLDSDVQMNMEQDRQITSRLYGGNGDTRIQQEILLGIGGIRALDALGIQPSVYHMNEGHSAFLGFELTRKWMQKYNISFKEACDLVSSSSVFTIHTPVPAGIDVFSHDSMDVYFTAFREELGISRDEFLSLGFDKGNHHGFNMASLAMKLAAGRNGVSKLHGAVTRSMFNSLWSGLPENEVPITHVTNGIHTLTWLSKSYKKLFDKYFDKDWENRISDKEVWKAIDTIPNDEIWQEHLLLKENMARYVNERIRLGYVSSNSIKRCKTLDPGVLTIGFSRRFATYKRADLIFRDITRIKNILNIHDMPVQIIFAGKAHPADKPAQDIINYINDVSEQEGFEGKVVLLENYNIALARRLVQSVDVWLNNPRMPLEASGTSGQKAGLNGVLNLSVLDGWWREGYNDLNGWAIGSDQICNNEFCQDNADSESLYEILENSLIPMYYDRNEKGVPVKWVNIMKESIKSLAAEYSTQRMVQNYTDQLYIPSMERTAKLFKPGEQDCSPLVQMSQWKRMVNENWQYVTISEGEQLHKSTTPDGEKIMLESVVGLGGLHPEDVSVELFYGSLDSNGNIIEGKYMALELFDEVHPGVYKYRADFRLADGGEYGYNFRILPFHPLLADKYDLRLVKWAEA